MIIELGIYIEVSAPTTSGLSEEDLKVRRRIFCSVSILFPYKERWTRTCSISMGTLSSNEVIMLYQGYELGSLVLSTNIDTSIGSGDREVNWQT